MQQVLDECKLRFPEHPSPETAIQDAYFDGTTAAPGAVSTVLPHATLHRDLQHRKKNIHDNFKKFNDIISALAD